MSNSKFQISKLKNGLKKAMIVFLLIGGVFLPKISEAGGSYIICQIDRASGKCQAGTEKLAHYEGIIPCGKTVNITGIGERVVPCQLCHFLIMFKGIVDLLFLPPTGLVFLLAILMFVLAGAMFVVAHLISPDNPTLIQQAQKALWSVLVGLVIIFAAWVLVNTLFVFIGLAKTDFGQGLKGWYKINCPIQLP